MLVENNEEIFLLLLLSSLFFSLYSRIHSTKRKVQRQLKFLINFFSLEPGEYMAKK